VARNIYLFDYATGLGTDNQDIAHEFVVVAGYDEPSTGRQVQTLFSELTAVDQLPYRIFLLFDFEIFLLIFVVHRNFNTFKGHIGLLNLFRVEGTDTFVLV